MHLIEQYCGKGPRLYVVLLLAFSLLASQPTKAQQVYVTKSGEKYHLTTCQYLKSSKIAIELEKALDLGYSPCKVCRPPIEGEQVNERKQLSTTPTTTTTTRCTALTQSGLRCKRSTSNSNGHCWQHQNPKEN